MQPNISIQNTEGNYEFSHYEIPLFSDQLAGIFEKSKQIIFGVWPALPHIRDTYYKVDPVGQLLESFQNKWCLDFWPTAQFDHDQIPSYLTLLSMCATSLFAWYYCSGIFIL